MRDTHPRGLAHRPCWGEGWGRPNLGSECQRKHMARAMKDMCGDTHTLNGTDEMRRELLGAEIHLQTTGN